MGGLNAKFSTLFKEIDGVYDCRRGTVVALYRALRVVKRMFLKNNLRFHVLTEQDFDLLRSLTQSIVKDNNIEQYLVAMSFSEFIDTSDIDYQTLFVPSDKVNGLVQTIVDGFQSNDIIGLHIRRSDNVESISRSPIIAFENKIEMEIDRNEKARFFLATDDFDVQHHLANRYGKRIITTQGVKNRNTEEGIIQATVELFTLARCKRILGSYYSSYSELAARLGHRDLEIVKSDNR